MRITVSTGGLSRRVTATDPYDAVKVFILKYKPKSMGVLASCVSKELDDTYYVSTERALKELGMWSKA